MSEGMIVLKQTEIKHPVYAAKLESGVIINVYGDYAIGTDGKRYYHIGRENDGMLETIGWSCEVEKAVIME